MAHRAELASPRGLHGLVHGDAVRGGSREDPARFSGQQQRVCREQRARRQHVPRRVQDLHGERLVPGEALGRALAARHTRRAGVARQEVEPAAASVKVDAVRSHDPQPAGRAAAGPCGEVCRDRARLCGAAHVEVEVARLPVVDDGVAQVPALHVDGRELAEDVPGEHVHEAGEGGQGRVEGGRKGCRGQGRVGEQGEPGGRRVGVVLGGQVAEDAARRRQRGRRCGGGGGGGAGGSVCGGQGRRRQQQQDQGGGAKKHFSNNFKLCARCVRTVATRSTFITRHSTLALKMMCILYIFILLYPRYRTV